MNALFISYDGLTDNLGQSQILPYIIELSKQGYEFTILSCEKKENFNKRKDTITQIVNTHHIKWEYIFYTKKPPVLSTLYDIIKLFNRAKKLHTSIGFNIVHCRSYIPSLIGLYLKKKSVKFIFDMRGFWADERVDGGLWNLSNPLFKLIYNYFKKKEHQFLITADKVVVLTNAAKQEMTRWKDGSLIKNKTVVIPCCADFTHFNLKNKNQEVCNKLNIPTSAKILCYLGSLGTWYMLDEMLETYHALYANDANWFFLIITPESPEIVKNKAKEKNIPTNNIKIISANRNEIPDLLSIADIGISYIKPSFSKKSSSPTKLAEMFACGIPLICNKGVGDVDEIILKNNLGILVDFPINANTNLLNEVNKLILISKKEIRSNATKILSLDIASEQYLKLYKDILTSGN
ncbi:MAG: glycosyltransferase [Bacteroidia bacterium]|nr:glycosyltransferase [Bacteroidia bacterium]